MIERKSRVPLEGWEFMINNGFGDNLTESVLDIYDCRGYYDRSRQGFADEVIQNDSFQIKQCLKLRKRPNSECEDFAEEWATQFIWECPTKFMLSRSVPVFT